jgi:hypothetical protein
LDGVKRWCAGIIFWCIVSLVTGRVVAVHGDRAGQVDDEL